MNIVEALKVAKEQRKKVRPVGANWYVVYKSDFIKKDIATDEAIMFYWCIEIEDAMSGWEIIKEKPSKETQYKIDSMKFQIVRYCKSKCCSCVGCEITKICDKCSEEYDETPHTNLLNNWSLKEIVEAYYILKKADEI